MKENDFDARPAPGAQQNDDDEDEQADDARENIIDRNVVRKRLLDKLGERLEYLAHSKNADYFKNNFYDPLEDDL